MTRTPIRFGTDGWRAIIAEDYTFENVRDCAEGVARYLEGSRPRRPRPRHRLRHALRLGELRRRQRRGGRRPRHQDLPLRTAAADAHGLPRHPRQARRRRHRDHRLAQPRRPTTASSTSPSTPAAPRRRSSRRSKRAIEAGQAEGDAEAPRARDRRSQQGMIERFDPRPAYDAHVAPPGRPRPHHARRPQRRLRRHARHRRRRPARACSPAARRASTELRGERNPAFPGMAAPEPIARNLTRPLGGRGQPRRRHRPGDRRRRRPPRRHRRERRASSTSSRPSRCSATTCWSTAACAARSSARSPARA